MNKKQFSIDRLIPIKYCMEYLQFVSNPTMKRNVAYNLQYLNFLYELYENYEITKSVERSFIKNQIVILGSILECFIFSLLKINAEKLDLGSEWQEDGKTKRFIDLNEAERVKTVIQKMTPGILKERSDLSWLIDIAENNRIFGKDYASTAHFVREYRNQIHLTTMKELEYEYFTEDKLLEAKQCVYEFFKQLSGKTSTEIRRAFRFL